MTPNDRSFVIKIISITFMIASLALVTTLLAGLWFPQVDNRVIFQILGPLANNITGAMIAVFSALCAVKLSEAKPESPTKEGTE